MIHKIEIDWGFRSPHLQALTGTVRIDSLNMGMIDKEDNPGFRVRKEINTLGYQSCPPIFSRCKPLVDVMVRSYFDGMRLEDNSYVWFNGCSRHNDIVTLLMQD